MLLLLASLEYPEQCVVIHSLQFETYKSLSVVPHWPWSYRIVEPEPVTVLLVTFSFGNLTFPCVSTGVVLLLGSPTAETVRSILKH